MIVTKRHAANPQHLTSDEKHCLKCFYHSKLGGYVCCEFILVTGKMRGCVFGRKCTRFLAGDPRSRWGMDPEFELEPGVLPGGAPEKKRRRQRRVALDQEALARLKLEHTHRELAQATGTSVSLWNNLHANGAISPDLAEQVKALYGIDLISK